MQRSFKIYDNDLEKNISCQQLPITAAYAFRDYRSQGQMIPYALINIACPPNWWSYAKWLQGYSDLCKQGSITIHYKCGCAITTGLLVRWS